MPRVKPAVPFSFWRREKKASVFSRPMIRVRPIRKRTWGSSMLGIAVRWGKGREELGWAGLARGSYVSHCESRARFSELMLTVRIEGCVQ